MTRRAPTSPAFWERDLAACFGLSLLAWFHRICLLYSNRDRAWPFSLFYEGDAETFFNYAVAIRQGQLYDSGIPFHPPLFPHLLALVQELLGVGTTSSPGANVAVRLLLALVGSLPVGLLYVLARPYLGRAAALCAALLATYHFGLGVIAIAPVSEAFYLTLLLSALVWWSRGFDHALSAPREDRGRERRAGGESAGASVRGWLQGAGLGVLSGLLALTRAEGLLFGVVLLLVLALTGRGRATKQAALLGAVALVATLAPWTISNYSRLTALNRSLAGAIAEPVPTFVPVTLYGPLNLALANHEGADGTFSRESLDPKSFGARLELRDPDHLRYLLHGDQLAFRYISQHPGAWLALVLRKWSLYFDALRLGFTQWDLPGGLSGLRRPVDLFVPHSPLALFLTWPLLLGGVLLAWRGSPATRRWLGLTALLSGLSLATTALFFGYARQAILLLPLWLGLMAVSITALLARLPWLTARGRGRAILIGLVAVLLVVEVLGSLADRDYVATGEQLPDSPRLNPNRPMEIRPH